MKEEAYIPDIEITLPHFVDLVIVRYGDYLHAVESDYCCGDRYNSQYIRGKIVGISTCEEIIRDILRDMLESIPIEKKPENYPAL